MALADDEVIYARHRKLRNLGHGEPGVSLPRDESEEFDILDDLGDHHVFVTIYESGRVVIDLQVES